MNREYNSRVSSKNSERLLKNLKNTTGVYFFLPHPVHHPGSPTMRALRGVFLPISRLELAEVGGTEEMWSQASQYIIYVAKPAFDFIRAENFENVEKQKYHLMFSNTS